MALITPILVKLGFLMNYIEVYRQYDIVVKSISADWLDLHLGFITYSR